VISSSILYEKTIRDSKTLHQKKIKKIKNQPPRSKKEALEKKTGNQNTISPRPTSKERKKSQKNLSRKEEEQKIKTASMDEDKNTA